jgi:hypothetical protein
MVVQHVHVHICLLKFLFISLGGVRLSPCWHIITAPDDRWAWSIRWNENLQGKPKYTEKTYPSATLSNMNPTWSSLGLNLGHHSGKLATNSLSCVTWYLSSDDIQYFALYSYLKHSTICWSHAKRYLFSIYALTVTIRVKPPFKVSLGSVYKNTKLRNILDWGNLTIMINDLWLLILNITWRGTLNGSSTAVLFLTGEHLFREVHYCSWCTVGCQHCHILVIFRTGHIGEEPENTTH